MGTMNLLKGNWTGKVGQTVGAKWKTKSTIRTYAIPSNPKTQSQLKVRGAFKDINSFVALFADGIRYLSALDTSGMSVRNAIVKLNKEVMDEGSFDKTHLQVSKGGLQKITGGSAEASTNKVQFTWTKPTATNFSDLAQLVLVCVQEESGIVDVVTAKYDALTLTSNLDFETGEVDVYAYYIDVRGSNRIGSPSNYYTATIE